MKQKITVRFGLTAFIAIVATAIGVTLVFYNLFQNRVHSDLRQSAELLMETEVFLDVYESSEDNAVALSHLNAANLRITWIDEDGTVLFDNDFDPHGLPNHLNRPEIQEAFKNGEGESTRRSNTMNMDTFYYALLLENGTVLRVSTQARTLTSIFMTVVPVIIIITILILLACVFIGHYLIRQLMKPIEEMAENLDDINRVSAYKELEPFANKIRSQHENILEAANNRQDFTASVSHELKTPITAISGYAELIETGIVDGEDKVHIAKQIRHNADRLLSLINDIIQLSELDHKELPRKFEQADLYELAKECVEQFRTQADNKSISLVLEGESVLCNVDTSLFCEMMNNLIQNSIRYSDNNGHVWVRIFVQNGHPAFSVEDDGIGIPENQQARVFERFYRVDKSRSRETGGTGLGLAIVKHIADIHNAEISLHSVLGEGTKIQIEF